jgi:DNA-binding Lrp family transcriptional regulator
MNMKKLMAKAPKRYQIEDFDKISVRAFEKLLPSSVPQIIKEDIAQYFHYLRNDRSKVSLKEWEKRSGCKDQANSWKVEGYRPIFAFLYTDRITDGHFLPLLLTKIENTFGESGQKMTIPEFSKLCRLSIIGFRPDIDDIDLKILQALSVDPLLVTQTLADQIGHSYATVYNHLKRLKEKLGLRVNTSINWSKLGVQRFYLISQEEDILDEFNAFQPFHDSTASFIWGDVYHLRYYLIRENLRKSFLDSFRKILVNNSNNLRGYELNTAPISGFNFDLFNIKDQRWHFDFATVFRNKELENESSINSTKMVFPEEFPPKEPYELSNMESRILEGLYGNYSLSQKELAEQLDVHAPNLSTIKNRLQEQRIIKPNLFMRLGLPLFCFLWCSAKDFTYLEILISLMQKIPYYNISPINSIGRMKEKSSALICFLSLDDVLYYSLVTFLMELKKDNLIDDFKIGLIVDSVFGTANVENVMEKELSLE